MTTITVYDVEADMLSAIADSNDTTIAEVVAMLCDYADDMKNDNNLI